MGVGAGVGVAVGLAILAAGFFYIKHRPSKKRDEEPQEAREGSDDKGPELQQNGRAGELPADEDPRELIDPKDASWELNGMDIEKNGAPSAKASALADVAG